MCLLSAVFRDTKKDIIVSFTRAQLVENKGGSNWTPGSINENYEKQPRDAGKEAGGSNEYQ